MTPAQRKKSWEGYLQATKLPADKRESFILGYAPDDQAVRAKIRAALAAHEKQSSATPAIPAVVSTILAQGHRIKQYQIEKHIGGGGFGDVYLATDPSGPKVAIKVLKTARNSEMYLATFKRERQMVADWDHTNIVRLIDGGITDISRLPYSVMEYVDGEPIDEYCNNHKLRIDQRLELFLQVCEAVQYVHRHFVAHGDLKPNNILVTEGERTITPERNRIRYLARQFIRRIIKNEKATKESQVKLLDFGIATLFGPHPHLAPSSTNPQAMTLGYASPEQVLGATGSVPADVYSLGAVLYEIVTGHPAHNFPPGSSVEEKKRIICEVKPSLPSEVVQSSEKKIRKLRRQIKGDLDSILLKALEKDPRQRYMSSSELAEDLRRHHNRFPVTARNQTFLYRITKWIRRHQTVLTVLALPLFLVIYRSVPFVRQYVAMYYAEPAALKSCETAVALGRFAAFEVQDEIEKQLPDSLPKRRALAEALLKYLSDLEPEVEDNLLHQREVGEFYHKLGNKFRNIDSGDPPFALRSYQKALDIREKLCRKDPSNDTFREELVSAYRARSDLRRDIGDWYGAEEDRRKAIELGR